MKQLLKFKDKNMRLSWDCLLKFLLFSEYQPPSIIERISHEFEQKMWRKQITTISEEILTSKYEVES
jgi:hypothetical protein